MKEKLDTSAPKSKMKPRLSSHPCPAYGKDGQLPKKLPGAKTPKVKGNTKPHNPGMRGY